MPDHAVPPTWRAPVYTSVMFHPSTGLLPQLSIGCRPSLSELAPIAEAEHTVHRLHLGACFRSQGEEVPTSVRLVEEIRRLAAPDSGAEAAREALNLRLGSAD